MQPPIGSENNRSSAWPSLLIAVGLFAAAVAIYANSLGHQFVWDDRPVIQQNPFLTESGAWWRCFGRDFGLEIVRQPVGYYRPLVFLSFLLDHATGDLNPFVYHLTNVLLHGLNTVLVFWLLAALAGRTVGALAAAVFAVHPVHAASVAFVAGRSDLLCAFFLLLTLLATVRSLRARPAAARMAWLGTAVTTYALALLSKELAIALPPMLLAYALIHRYRGRSLLRLCAPTALIAAAYLLLRALFLPMAGLGRPGEPPPGNSLAHAAQMFFQYAAQQTYPVLPTLGARVPTRRLPVDLAAVVLLVLLLVAAKPRRKAADDAAWLILFLAPPFWLNLSTGLELSDRFAYVPSIGICFLAGLAAARFFERERLARVAVAIVLIAFAALSFVFSRMWRDSISLWSASVAYHNQCGRSYFNLADAYRKAGDRTRAVLTLRKLTRLFPDDDDLRFYAFANMAEILAEADEKPLAIESCRQALAIWPHRYGIRRLLASLLSDQGRHDEAIAELLQALHDAPDNAALHLDLAQEYLAVQPPQPDRARDHYGRALQLGAQADPKIDSAIGFPTDGQQPRLP